jgi:hypothetical protein
MNIARFTGLGRSFFIATALAVAAAAAQAVPVTYTFGGVANGTVGTQAFVRNDLLVTVTTDTTNIDTTRFGSGIPATAALINASFSLSGFGSGTLTQAVYVFNNQGTQTLGFGNIANNDLINLKNVAVPLNTYGLVTPLTFMGTLPNFISQFQNVGTSLGALSLSGLTDSVFTASVAAVPEPSTYGMSAAGLMVVVGALARRRRAACGGLSALP